MAHAIALSRAEALDAFRTACRYDVLAVKPGNVSIHSPGHGMTARDFLASAAAAADPATDISRPLGDGIRAAVKASVTAAGCNTNLGILLLCVPLLRAALLPSVSMPLRARLRPVLAAADLADSAAVFEAIRIANPGGLGSAPAEDVHAAPSRALRAIMALAADRDLIARQYADDFAAVFNTGVSALREECARGESLASAATHCYLEFLGGNLDSHVVRKRGEACAADVAARARAVASALKACEDPRARQSVLAEFDAELKREGVNPGTSADLTVASLAAWLLDTALREEAVGNPIRPRAGGHA
ncbi:MAG: triphosphoribosyl-dephospho-CoA synthase [Gammaproteobacteria bacterium]